MTRSASATAATVYPARTSPSTGADRSSPSRAVRRAELHADPGRSCGQPPPEPGNGRDDDLLDGEHPHHDADHCGNLVADDGADGDTDDGVRGHHEETRSDHLPELSASTYATCRPTPTVRRGTGRGRRYLDEIVAEGAGGCWPRRSCPPDCLPVLPDHPLGRHQKAEAVRRLRRRPSMCGRPEPATAKVLPTRPSKDGSGTGASAPGTSATFTKYDRTRPIPSRS